jgi:hypothetical protein
MKPWLRDAERFNCNPICFAQLCRVRDAPRHFLWSCAHPKATRGRAALQKRFAQNEFVGSCELDRERSRSVA